MAGQGKGEGPRGQVQISREMRLLGRICLLRKPRCLSFFIKPELSSESKDSFVVSRLSSHKEYVGRAHSPN